MQSADKKPVLPLWPPIGFSAFGANLLQVNS